MKTITITINNKNNNNINENKKNYSDDWSSMKWSKYSKYQEEFVQHLRDRLENDNDNQQTYK